MKNAIRLTNKTAKALRRRADKVRSGYFAAAGLLSAVMAYVAVRLGMKQLAAVPITVALTVLADYLLIMRANTVHLTLTAQAICTEAAAREIRAGTSESQRRQKAITDLISVKADSQNAAPEKKQAGQAPFFEDEEDAQDENDRLQAGDTMKIRPVMQKNAENKKPGGGEKPAARRRRRKDKLTLIRSEQAR